MVLLWMFLGSIIGMISISILSAGQYSKGYKDGYTTGWNVGFQQGQAKQEE